MRQILVSERSYIDEISHGLRSRYMRTVLDAHIVTLGDLLGTMGLGGYSDSRIIDLVLEAGEPRSLQPADLDRLDNDDREAIFALADETTITGIDIARLLTLLKSGART
jgi:hypothetical protein